MSSLPDDKDKKDKARSEFGELFPSLTDFHKSVLKTLEEKKDYFNKWYLGSFDAEPEPLKTKEFKFDAADFRDIDLSDIERRALAHGLTGWRSNGGRGGAGGSATGRFSSMSSNVAASPGGGGAGGYAGFSLTTVIIDDPFANGINTAEANALRGRHTMTCNIKDTKEAMRQYLKADIPCFLWGAPGVGKSDAVRQIASENKLALIDFRAILRDPVDIRGLPSIDRDSGTAKWLPPSDLPNAKRDGAKGILFMDELNAAPQSVQAACFGLVLDRKVGEYHLPPGWRIIAAGNRQSDKAAAQRMPSALANRFAHIDVIPTVDDFTNWANGVDLDPMIVAFIRFRPELLHKMEGDGRTFPSPRAWANVGKLLTQGVPEVLRHRLVSGLVGEGASTELEGFIRIYSKLPSLDHILVNPKGADVPTEPAALYAIASGLSRKVTQKNFQNALIYMARTKKEFEVMFAIDAVKRSQEISHTRAFVDWTARNNSVMI